MNKRGAIQTAITDKFIYAIIIAIIFIIVMVSGGFMTIIQLTSFLSQIPIWVWPIFLVLFLIGGKRR